MQPEQVTIKNSTKDYDFNIDGRRVRSSEFSGRVADTLKTLGFVIAAQTKSIRKISSEEVSKKAKVSPRYGSILHHADFGINKTIEAADVIKGLEAFLREIVRLSKGVEYQMVLNKGTFYWVKENQTLYTQSVKESMQAYAAVSSVDPKRTQSEMNQIIALENKYKSSNENFSWVTISVPYEKHLKEARSGIRTMVEIGYRTKEGLKAFRVSFFEDTNDYSVILSRANKIAEAFTQSASDLSAEQLIANPIFINELSIADKFYKNGVFDPDSVVSFIRSLDINNTQTQDSDSADNKKFNYLFEVLKQSGLINNYLEALKSLDYQKSQDAFFNLYNQFKKSWENEWFDENFDFDDALRVAMLTSNQNIQNNSSISSSEQFEINNSDSNEVYVNRNYEILNRMLSTVDATPLSEGEMGTESVEQPITFSAAAEDASTAKNTHSYSNGRGHEKHWAHTGFSGQIYYDEPSVFIEPKVGVVNSESSIVKDIVKAAIVSSVVSIVIRNNNQKVSPVTPERERIILKPKAKRIKSVEPKVQNKFLERQVSALPTQILVESKIFDIQDLKTIKARKVLYKYVKNKLKVVFKNKSLPKIFTKPLHTSIKYFSDSPIVPSPAPIQGPQPHLGIAEDGSIVTVISTRQINMDQKRTKESKLNINNIGIKSAEIETVISEHSQYNVSTFRNSFEKENTSVTALTNTNVLSVQSSHSLKNILDDKKKNPETVSKLNVSKSTNSKPKQRILNRQKRKANLKNIQKENADTISNVSILPILIIPFLLQGNLSSLIFEMIRRKKIRGQVVNFIDHTGEEVIVDENFDELFKVQNGDQKELEYSEALTQDDPYRIRSYNGYLSIKADILGSFAIYYQNLVNALSHLELFPFVDEITDNEDQYSYEDYASPTWSVEIER